MNNELTKEQKIIKDIEKLIKGYEKCKNHGVILDSKSVFKRLDEILAQ